MSSTTQRPPKRQSAAQRASEANHAHQLAVNGKTGRPADRRTQQDGETSDAGLSNDNRPVGVARSKR